jgi:hypothetical protein
VPFAPIHLYAFETILLPDSDDPDYLVIASETGARFGERTDPGQALWSRVIA